MNLYILLVDNVGKEIAGVADAPGGRVRDESRLRILVPILPDII